MNKEFIPYKQALALKELGFDEHCFMIYYVDNKALAKLDGLPIGIKNTELDNTLGKLLKISAPLYQQAFRWFREKYELGHNIEPYSLYTHIIELKDVEDDDPIEYDIYHIMTYEEAELACLKKLIELAKNK